MANDFDEFLPYVMHLRAEHKKLSECVHRIEQHWSLQHQRLAPADALVAILESLEALRAELARHFEEEESGGCLEEAVSHQPNLSHVVTQLERQHPELLEQMDGMIERLRALSRLAASTADIKEDFRVFAEKLHAHEAAENRVLEETSGIEVE